MTKPKKPLQEVIDEMNELESSILVPEVTIDEIDLLEEMESHMGSLTSQDFDKLNIEEHE